jgi:phosphinothricin acetyltransferase
MAETYRLVQLVKKHAAGMLRIFNRHISRGFAAYREEPVGEAVMATFLRQVADYPAVAVEAPDGALLGFGFLRAYSPHATFAHTAQSTIFLDPEHTRAGIGTEVLLHLEEGARSQGITRILAHISSRNPASIAFHYKHGFAHCGRFPGIGRKWGEPFDVIWMVKTLPSAGA